MIPDEDANEAAEQHNFPQMIHDEHGNIQVLLPEGYDLRETYYIYDENGTKIQLVPLQHPDGTIDHHHLVPQFEINHEGEEQIIEEGDEMMALENAEIEGEVAENEYDQFQMDLGNDWDNMGNVVSGILKIVFYKIRKFQQMILVNEDDTLEEEHVEDVDHQIIENVEGDEGVIEINGQPLFD